MVPRVKMLKMSAWLLHQVTMLHLSHAIVVRLHVRKSYVVILTPETAGKVGV